MKRTNPYTNTKRVIRAAAEAMNLDPEVRGAMLHPEREIAVSFSIRMDSGEIRRFQGWRVQHNNALGPYKGGTRYHPDVYLDEFRFLGTGMTIKCGVGNLPFGGGKGGIRCDPKGMSVNELKLMTEAYTGAIAHVIGPHEDILAPDVNTGPETMGWIVDEYAAVTDSALDEVLGVATGKSPDRGGLKEREVSTARGGLFVLRKALDSGFVLLDGLEGARVVIQGYGNAGHYFAKFMYKEGARVIAVSDSKGGIHNKDGLEPESVLEHKKSHPNRTVVGYEGADEITNEALLELECDILVPAALESVITRKNARKVNSSVVVELANGPTTVDADDILYRRGITVLPDVLANAGGVIGSYHEWEQNVDNVKWKPDDVDDLINGRLRENALYVFRAAEAEGVNNRIGAYMLAMERIAKAMKAD